MGVRRFAECLLHSAKAWIHSAKFLPRVTLGTEHSEKNLSAKPSLPSAQNEKMHLTQSTRQKTCRQSRLCRVREMKKCEKNPIFLIGGGAHRPAPAYAVDGIRTYDLSLARYLLSHLHYTLICVYMPFRLLKYYTKPSEN
jgi:hypothetical protein